MVESVTLSLVSGETMHQIRHCFESDTFPSVTFESVYTIKNRALFCIVIALLATVKQRSIYLMSI